MKKEQYLIFKSDFKKSIEYVKLNKMHRKSWENDGFESEEAQKEAIESCNKKKKDILNSYKLTVAKADEQNTHIAYYIAKHQLSGEDADKYILDELKKRKDFEDWCVKYNKNSIYNILKKYEEIVCTD